MPTTIHVELDRLQASLNDALNSLRREMDAADLPPLSQLAIHEHPLDNLSGYLPSSGLYEARRLSLACLGELKNLIQSPFDKAVQQGFANYDTASIKTFVRAGIAERLARAADPHTGLSVAELQADLDLDARKLSPILRYLSMSGWVRETKEGVFALNRPSLSLLKDKIGYKFLQTDICSAMTERLPAWIQNSDWKYSDSPVQTTFQMTYNTNLQIFDWLKVNRDEIDPFFSAVMSFGEAASLAILSDYPWQSLECSTIIDCGGGYGDLIISLAHAYPSYHFILQDQEEMAALASVNIQKQMPVEYASGVISVQVHDFFTLQPHNGNEFTFIMRHVLHDWPDSDATKILNNLARAAGPESKILLIERVSVPGVISEGTDSDMAFFLDQVMGHALHKPMVAPPGIPYHFGAASSMAQALSFFLLSMSNANDRTLKQWESVINQSGLKITGVYPLRAMESIIECAVERIV